jgi:hypothetical protein
MAKEKAYIHKWLGKHSRNEISIKYPRITWNPSEGKVSATQARVEKRIERQIAKRQAFWLCTSGFISKDSVNEIFFIDGGGWVDYCDGNSYGRSHRFFIEHSGHFFPFIDLRKKCPLLFHFSRCGKWGWGTNEEWYKKMCKEKGWKPKPIKTI